MATKRKKVVVDPNPLQAQYLGKQRAQHLLPRTARQSHDPSTNRRPSPRTRHNLPSPLKRKTTQKNARTRPHVAGTAPPTTRPQPPPTPTPPRRQNNIANKLLAPRPIQARDHNSLRHA